MTLYQFHTWMRAGDERAEDGKNLTDWILVERDGDALQITSSLGARSNGRALKAVTCKSTTVAHFATIDPDTKDEVFSLSGEAPINLVTRGRFRATSGEARLTRQGEDLHLMLNGRSYVSAERHAEQEAYFDLIEIASMNSTAGQQAQSRLG